MTREESSTQPILGSVERPPGRRHPTPTGLHLSRLRANTQQGGLLEVDDISFQFGHDDQLDHLSFRARPGHSTLVVGASPEMRVALLGVLSGTVAPAHGVVQVDGQELTGLPLAGLRSITAVALRRPRLKAGTLADNIAHGESGADSVSIRRAAELAGVTEFTQSWKLGLYTDVSERAPELTLGQRRLVALARAVLRQPRLLLVEEPTSDLPPTEEAAMIRALDRITRRFTTVITTDRLTLADPGDQIVRLDRGRPEATITRRPMATRSGPQRRLTSGHRLAPGLTSATLIDQGPLTQTWLAWALDRDHLVQVRTARGFLAPFPARRQLVQEYERIVRLRHPGLVRPIEADLSGPEPYAVYEHVGGPTLDAVIGNDAQLPDPRAVMRMGYELARTLSTLHHQDLVHLDLRAQIAVLSPQGTILTDLSQARPIGYQPGSTYRHGQVGTVAPEQVQGAPAHPSMDMFTLGVLMYQAAAGMVSTAYHGTSRDRNLMLGPRPVRRRPPVVNLYDNPQRWHPAGSARTGIRRHTRATWTVAEDVAGAVKAMVGRLTAANPADRPTAEQAMALMRPFLFAEPGEP